MQCIRYINIYKVNHVNYKIKHQVNKVKNSEALWYDAAEHNIDLASSIWQIRSYCVLPFDGGIRGKILSTDWRLLIPFLCVTKKRNIFWGTVQFCNSILSSLKESVAPNLLRISYPLWPYCVQGILLAKYSHVISKPKLWCASPVNHLTYH